MISIVIPYLSEYETVKSGLEDLRQAGIGFKTSPIQGSLIANQRNEGVNGRRSQKIYQEPIEGFSHFLFVDSDIGFTARHVTDLMELDVPIAACPYFRHESDGTYQAGIFSEPGVIKGHHTSERTGVIKVDFVGAGFLLIRREAFSKMRYPWFRYGLIERDGVAANIGEDIGFCINAKEAGFDIWCDFDNPVYHRPRIKDQTETGNETWEAK